jgi:HSP20 family protein
MEATGRIRKRGRGVTDLAGGTASGRTARSAHRAIGIREKPDGSFPPQQSQNQQRKADQMSTLLLHRDPKTIVPDLVDWFEEPFLTLRPYLGQPIKIEEYVEGDHYLIRAELAGIDPEKDVEIMVGSGYLTIRAERSDKIEGKHRSEFRYGSFSRTLSLPVNADEDAVTANYHDGILTISVGLKTEQKASAKKIEVTKDK